MTIFDYLVSTGKFSPEQAMHKINASKVLVNGDLETSIARPLQHNDIVVVYEWVPDSPGRRVVHADRVKIEQRNNPGPCPFGKRG